MLLKEIILFYICSILIAHFTIFSFHLISGSNSSAIETRLCVVGKENGENKNLMEAIQVNKEEMFLVYVNGSLERYVISFTALCLL